jgi:hypothetical protein
VGLVPDQPVKQFLAQQRQPSPARGVTASPKAGAFEPRVTVRSANGSSSMNSPAFPRFKLPTVSMIAGVVLLASFLATGCQNTPASRIREYPELFQSVDEFSQRLIRAGLVNHGFSADLVYLALGKPNRITAIATVNGSVETWTYRNFLYAQHPIAKLTVSGDGPTLGGLMSSPGGPDAPGSASGGTGQLQLTLANVDVPIGTLLIELLEGVVVAIRIER